MIEKKIVVVEDDESIRKTFYLLLKKKYKVFLAKDSQEALRRFQGSKIDLIIADLKLPGQSGLDLIGQLRDSGYKGDAILISAYPDLLDIAALNRYSISHFFTKPLDLEDFSRSIDYLLASRNNGEKGLVA